MDANRARKNFRQVQKIVKGAVDIIDHAVFVSVYSYKAEEGGGWERVEIEGPLFLVQRTPDEQHPEAFALLVVNRSSSVNLIKYIGPTFEHDGAATNEDGQETYFMFRCNEAEIYGLWFTEDEQRASISRRIEAIMDSYKKNKPNTGGGGSLPPMLQQMFTHAAATASSGDNNGIGSTAEKDTTPASFSGPNADANFCLSKEQMKDVLTKLVQTDKFIDVLHSTYLKSVQNQAQPQQMQQQQQQQQMQQPRMLAPSPLRQTGPPTHYGGPPHPMYGYSPYHAPGQMMGGHPPPPMPGGPMHPPPQQQPPPPHPQ